MLALAASVFGSASGEAGGSSACQSGFIGTHRPHERERVLNLRTPDITGASIPHVRVRHAPAEGVVHELTSAVYRA